MIKILFISILLLTTINARENPFFPIVGEKDIPITSNQNRAKAPLKRATITLPAQARVLKKVTLEYKNLDGSLESKSIELDNAVDWHLPIFISQTYSTQTTSAQITPTPKNNENIIKEEIKPNEKKKIKFDRIFSITHLKISYSNKKLKLMTDDKIIRDFLLVNPHRIVIDFEKDTDIKSYTRKYPDAIFKEIRIGNHKGYYRAVIELDGVYRYDMKKTSYGYFLELI